MIRASRRLATLALGAMFALTACGDDDDGPTGGGSRAALRVVNTSSRPIFFVYFSACTDAQWGPDRLGDATIAPGQSFTFGDLPPGCYDLRADLDDNRTTAEYEVQLRAGQRYDWRPAAGSFVFQRTAPADGASVTLRKATRVPAVAY